MIKLIIKNNAPTVLLENSRKHSQDDYYLPKNYTTARCVTVGLDSHP